MGPPYTYERVAEDREKYSIRDEQGRALPWWKDYLRDEGYEVEYATLTDFRRFSDFCTLPQESRALLVFQIPHMRMGHIVAIDQQGVIDPQVSALQPSAEYQSVDDFCDIFHIEGWRLYDRGFWLIRKRTSIKADPLPENAGQEPQ